MNETETIQHAYALILFGKWAILLECTHTHAELHLHAVSAPTLLRFMNKSRRTRVGVISAHLSILAAVPTKA